MPTVSNIVERRKYGRRSMGTPRARALLRRAAIAGAVAAIHVLLFQVIRSESDVSGVPEPAQSFVVYFVTLPRAATSPPESARPRRTGEQARQPRMAPRDGKKQQELEAIAALVVPDDSGQYGRGVPDPSIPEATPVDIRAVRVLCDTAYSEEDRQLGRKGVVTLLIRVETDGHVSEAKIEESTGWYVLDQAAAQCLGHSRFELARQTDYPAAPWQRAHWTFSTE